MELIHLTKKEDEYLFTLRILSDKEIEDLREKEKIQLLIKTLGSELSKGKIERMKMNKSLEEKDATIERLGKEV